jgi:OmpA family
MPEDKGTRNATIVFPEGSTTLSQPASAEVKAFAGKRGNGVIMVTGFGEAASADPATQSAAINMGLARAIAIAAALKEAGVPGPAIRVSAEATGRGASLVLLQ